jgi:RNA polymerase sigma-70 factor (ECF subfamily)
MEREPTTHVSLLVRMRDARDRTAWAQFVDVYGPLVYRYVRRRGLQDADAADVTQDVLRAVARAIDGFRYDPTRGSFRGWLFTTTRHELYRFQVARARLPQAGHSELDHLLEEQPARDDEESRNEWDREYDRRLFDWATERIRGEFQVTTWDAFWRTAVEHKSATEVAGALNMTVGAVYVAKSRVLARLKAVIAEAQLEE